MKNKWRLVQLVLFILIGAFDIFYITNNLLSDLSNSFYGFIDFLFVGSIPLFCIGIDIIMASFFLLRLYKTPEYKDALVEHYSLLLTIFSFIGVVSAFISGAFVYHSFTKPYPFPCYNLICLLVNLILFVFGLGHHINKKAKVPHPKKLQITWTYVLYNIVLSPLMYFTYYRLGALIWSPVYLHLRTLYLTWPFYCSLLIPFSCLVNVGLYSIGYLKKRPLANLIFASVNLSLHLAFNIATIVIGYNYPQFISAISPALPLERLATSPIDTLLNFVLIGIFAIYILVFSIIHYKKEKSAS